MKELITKNGKVIMVDDEDFEYLSQFTWDMHTRYARTNINQITIYLHKIILHCSSEDTVDHIDNNPLNNQKSNLRKCTKLENSRNRNLDKRNKSGYKGVSWYKRNEKWRACISVNRKYVFLGFYSNPTEAAIAYDMAAKKFYGDFASTNKSLGLLG